MTFDIAILLAQDGILNGAIYGLLALSTVIVFQITRVIFIPSGSIVAYAALTLAALQDGRLPPTVWLLGLLSIVAAILDLISEQNRTLRRIAEITLKGIAYPIAVAILMVFVKADGLPSLVQATLCGAILVPMGPALYRLVYAPLGQSSVLVLLIASIALDGSLVSFGLLAFGSEGVRASPLIDASLAIGRLAVTVQSLIIGGMCVAIVAALYIMFGHTLVGKALRATAINPVGARLVGIEARKAGRLAFSLATLIAVCAGVLAAPTTVIYYDSGFLIGLHGLVGAIIGGLESYPLAALGAVAIGLIESASAFEASEFKEVIVFSLLIPVLLVLTMRTSGSREEDDQL